MISIQRSGSLAPEPATRRERDVRTDGPFDAALSAAMTPMPAAASPPPPPERTGTDGRPDPEGPRRADAPASKPRSVGPDSAAGRADGAAPADPSGAPPADQPAQSGAEASAEAAVTNALRLLLKPEAAAAAGAPAPAAPKQSTASGQHETSAAGPKPTAAAAPIGSGQVDPLAAAGQQHGDKGDRQPDDPSSDPQAAAAPARAADPAPAAFAGVVGHDRGAVAAGPSASAAPPVSLTPPPTPDVAKAAVPVDRITIPLGIDGAAGAQLRVAVRGDVLHATILAADAGTARSLESGLGDLRRSLEQYGFRESRVVIQQARPAGAPAETREDNRPESGQRERDHSQRDPGARQEPRRRSPRQQ